ncbi:MAG: class I SAM-dependent methyltransferase [Sphingomonas sp.]
MNSAPQQIDAAQYYDHDQTDLLRLVTVPAHSVLEIGCASGTMLAHYLDQGASRVTGVEYVPAVADMARTRCPGATILSGDVDQIPVERIGSGYDLLLASYVLEHVADPWQTLGRLATLLRPGGQFVGALPNVRNWRVTFPLLLTGKWEYVESGIMDRTHLRFFSRATIVELLTATGFKDIKIVPKLYGTKDNLGNRLTLGIAVDHFAYGYQFSAIRE